MLRKLHSCQSSDLLYRAKGSWCCLRKGSRISTRSDQAWTCHWCGARRKSTWILGAVPDVPPFSRLAETADSESSSRWLLQARLSCSRKGESRCQSQAWNCRCSRHFEQRQELCRVLLLLEHCRRVVKLLIFSWSGFCHLFCRKIRLYFWSSSFDARPLVSSGSSAFVNQRGHVVHLRKLLYAKRNLRRFIAGWQRFYCCACLNSRIAFVLNLDLNKRIWSD